MTIPKPQKIIEKKNKTRKPGSVEKYLKYLEWADKNKLRALALTNPTMSQNFPTDLIKKDVSSHFDTIL